jgi:hypothetical protein
VSTDEVIDLLTLMASYDRRKVGEADVAAWYAAVSDLPFGDGRDAVIAHYRESTDWIMPAHVRQRVAAVRSERLRAAGNLEELIPEELADRPVEYAARLKEVTEAVRDGEPAPKAIGGAR